ncbi:MAG: PH domain-containing protein, partial [Acidimicrobiales bacterium]
PPEVLVRLPPSRLLLAGVTGPEVLAVLAAITVGLDFVSDLGVDPTEVEAVDASAAALAVLAVLGVPLWLVLAALIGLVRRWDLTATIVGDELRVTYGLLRRNEFVVKTSRVQDVRIAHRLLLRPFGRADVRVRTAASGSGDQSRVDIPLLDHAEVATVLARVLPAAAPLPTLQPAPAGARRRAVFRATVTSAMLAVVLGLLALRSTVPALAVAALVFVPVGAAWGEAYYRGLGHARDRGIVHSRTGALTRHRVVVPEARIQSGSTVASWFQRRRRLAHVRLDLAGGAVTVVDRDVTEASGILATSTDT